LAKRNFTTYRVATKPPDGFVVIGQAQTGWLPLVLEKAQLETDVKR